jgi:hypothetical protein
MMRIAGVRTRIASLDGLSRWCLCTFHIGGAGAADWLPSGYYFNLF